MRRTVVAVAVLLGAAACSCSPEYPGGTGAAGGNDGGGTGGTAASENPLCPGGILEGDYSIASDGDVEALAGCSTITGGLTVELANEAASIELPALQTVGADITVLGAHEVLTRLSLPALVAVGGWFEISSNHALAAVDLSALASVGGRLFLRGTALTTVAFPALARVGDIAFGENTRLTSIDLPMLLSADNSLDIGLNPVLTTVHVPALASLGQTVTFVDNEGLTTVELPALTSVGGIWVLGSGALVAVHLPALESIDGPLVLEQNSVLATFRAPVLTMLCGLSVRDNPHLPTCAVEAFRAQLDAAFNLCNQDISGNDDAGICR